jgi:hypothetical protein
MGANFSQVFSQIRVNFDEIPNENVSDLLL